jgi:GT2 family glycosyltransferase
VQASVVVPTRDRPRQLEACLAALGRLEGVDFEVVVVDDGSVEDVGPIVASYRPFARLVRQPGAGPARARNAGARAAQAAFVAFTDDDCVPEPGWLSALLGRWRADPEALVGGQVTNLLADDVCASASQTLCAFLYQYYRAAEGHAPFFTSNSIGCSRETFLALGGFDESFPLPAAEDRDLGLRWRASGRPLVYVPEAVVGHAHGMRLAGFWRQHTNYGRGAHHLHRLMRERGDPPLSIEGMGFYWGLISHPFRSHQRRALSQSVLLGLSQLAMVNGYWRQGRADRQRTESAACTGAARPM